MHILLYIWYSAHDAGAGEPRTPVRQSGEESADNSSQVELWEFQLEESG